jgi:hypothetical protein
MITELTGQDLPQWMAAAREAGLPGIASFAKGLEQDLDAAGSEVPLQTAPAAPVPGHRRVLVAQTHQLSVQTRHQRTQSDHPADLRSCGARHPARPHDRNPRDYAQCSLADPAPTRTSRTALRITRHCP